MYPEYDNLSQNSLSLHFFNACDQGDLDRVKYLLTSKSLKEHADIHYRDDFGFRIACRKGHLKIAQYLACSPTLKEHSNINTDDYYAFKWAAYYKRYDIVRFLIFDLNIEKSSSINNYLIAERDDNILKMFELREFNMELNKELSSNNNTSKNKPKI